MFEDIIREYGGAEVSAMDVYGEMFRLGDGCIQKENEPAGEMKANPIGYWKNDGEKTGHYRIFFEDTFEEVLQELQKADFSILNGITYFGRKNLQAHASKMYAMIFDIDGITDETLNNFLHAAFSKSEHYPIPNFIVLSGNNVHLIYVFEEPIPLFPNIKMQLKELKYALTRLMWNRYTSIEHDKVQFQGINQGFRVIGGKTKIDGISVRAFQVNRHPFSVEQLNEYVPEESRVDTKRLFRESKMSLEQARKKFPEWYERRILNQEPRGAWKCKEDLYNWWLRQIEGGGASVGHRYFCIMCLAIYAVKCGIDLDRVQEDAKRIRPYLNDLAPEKPFTDDDIESALDAFDERYITFPRDDIAKISAIPIKKNKRNGRRQADHILVMNKMKEVKRLLGEEVKDGRPSKADIVKSWRAAHPTGKKIDCERETGLSRHTVLRWWSED